MVAERFLCCVNAITFDVRHAQALWDIAAGRDEADHPTNAQVWDDFPIMGLAARLMMLNKACLIKNRQHSGLAGLMTLIREWRLTASRVLICRWGAPGLRLRS
jgi:hypothetical protein